LALPFRVLAILLLVGNFRVGAIVPVRTDSGDEPPRGGAAASQGAEVEH